MGIKVETVWQKDGEVCEDRIDGSTEARRVLEDFGDGYSVIPKGFVFDGASAPAILYPWVSPFSNLEVSARHDLDCQKARKLMARSIRTQANGYDVLSMELENEALKHRAMADTRYRKGMIKAKRASYKWKWRGNVVGSLAWVGVRVGSFFGVGW